LILKKTRIELVGVREMVHKIEIHHLI
jgi:hypothetical protein